MSAITRGDEARMVHLDHNRKAASAGNRGLTATTAKES